MTLTAKVLLAYLAVALIVLAWMFRINVTPSGNGFPYVTNRWTGRVYSCEYKSCELRYPLPSIFSN